MTDSPPSFDPKVFCSIESNLDLHNQLICFTVVNIILALTAVVGNTLILIALHKETSLHQPSKIPLCSLASSDLCLGYSTLLFVPYRMFSVLKQKWQTCQCFYATHNIVGSILFGVSLVTTTAISVDRLLALLSGLRYRQVVTIKRVYATVVVILVVPSFGAVIEFSILGENRIFTTSTIIVCLILSMYCYLRIYLKLRHRQIQVRQTNQTTPISLARYRNSVRNVLWVQLVLVFCVIPYCVIAPFAYSALGKRQSSALYTALLSTGTLAFFNASLNPFLYCWKIKQVRRAVKNTLKQISCSPNE